MPSSTAGAGPWTSEASRGLEAASASPCARWLIAEERAAAQDALARVRSGELTPAWFTTQRLRGEAERAAHRAANPTPPAPPWAGTYDPMAEARAWLAERGGEREGVRAAGEDARYEMATDAERREMADAVLVRNGNAQLAYSRQAERWPTASAATAAATTVAGSAVAVGSVAVPASVLLGLARTVAGLAQLAAAGLTITPAGAAALATAAAAGAMVHLLHWQHRSLVEQGALDVPRLVPPLPGFGDGRRAPTFKEELRAIPTVPQSTATPMPERLIDTVEKLVPSEIDPALVFENWSIEDFRKKLDGQLEHLDPTHLDAARQERAGKIVAEKDGRPYDHVQEVADAFGGMIKLTAILKRKLSHPGLSDVDRDVTTRLLSEASRKIEEVRRMVPGIDEEIGVRK